MRITRCLRQTGNPRLSCSPRLDPFNALTQVFEVPRTTDAAGEGLGRRLAGLTFAVKENICTTLGATTCCSEILGAASERPYRSPFDATCVKLLHDAGATMLAKTNMDEFGMGSFTVESPYGPTLNPRDTLRTAGGSSGGSAAALFVDQIHGRPLDFTIGTDTGGSVRLPAAYCGLYGFKPSYGLISRWGVVPYANSLDTVGIFARSRGGLAIIERVVDCLDRHDVKDPTSISRRTRESLRCTRETVDGARPPRIAVPVEFNVEELSPTVLAVWREGIERMVSQGCEVVPVSLPRTQAALAAYYVLAPAEVSSNLQKYSGIFYGSRLEPDRLDGRLYAATRSLFGSEARRRILLGCLSLSSERYDNHYLQAQRIRRRIVEDFNAIFTRPHPFLPTGRGGGVVVHESVDYLLTPTAPTEAPLSGEVARMSPAEAHAGDVFTVPASMAGLPSVSIPAGVGEHGLPVGLQLIGQFGDDRGVLRLAGMMETA